MLKEDTGRSEVCYTSNVMNVKLGVFFKLLYRLQSAVSGDLYEFYIFSLYLEQISVDEDDVDTRLRFHRVLTTPLLPCPVFTENRKS